MKIIYKLTMGFLIVSLSVLVVAYFSLSAANSTIEAYNEVREETIPVIENLENMKIAGIIIVVHTQEIVSILSENETQNEILEQKYGELLSGKEQYEKSFMMYEDLVNQYFPEEKEFAENIRSKGQDLEKKSSELIDLKKQGASASEIHEKLLELKEIETNYVKVIDDAFSHEAIEFEERTEELDSKITHTKNIIIIGSLLSIIIAIVIGGYLSSVLSKQIMTLRAGVGEITRGNFETRLEIKSNDEMGEMGEEFNMMAQALKRSKEEGQFDKR